MSKLFPNRSFNNMYILKIIIKNNTNKKVYIKLEKDDKTRPRVMISGEKGSVYIER